MMAVVRDTLWLWGGIVEVEHTGGQRRRRSGRCAGGAQQRGEGRDAGHTRRPAPGADIVLDDLWCLDLKVRCTGWLLGTRALLPQQLLVHTHHTPLSPRRSSTAGSA